MAGRRRPRSARDVAREVLRRVQQDRAYANLALSAELARAPHLASADRNLATELVYGVLRRRRILDHALGRHARRPLERLDAEVLDGLRLAAYQLLCLERVPAHAAVDDAVEAVRRARGPALAGFANAVLRRLARDDLREGLPEDGAARLAVEGSLPDALAARWIAQLGLDETRALAARLGERSALVGRVNTLRVSREALIERLAAEGARAERGRLAPEAVRLAQLPSPFTSASYVDGLWTAQDEAAQLASHLLAPAPGERLLDACAGVGGKSTHLAALAGDRGEVLCVDSSARKLELLQEHCLRLGIHSCSTRVVDLRHADALAGERFDGVLVDAPCSGLGVLGRHPELKWRLELEALPGLVELQRAILEAALRALRPGGRLVYSVCTTTEEEGPAQVAWLLERHPELEPEPAPAPVAAPTLAPVAASDGPLARIGEHGGYRLWPHRHDTDGFFMARLRRRDRR